MTSGSLRLACLTTAPKVHPELDETKKHMHWISMADGGKRLLELLMPSRELLHTAPARLLGHIEEPEVPLGTSVQFRGPGLMGYMMTT